MAYLTINGTAYLVKVGEGRGSMKHIGNSERAIDGSLLVDTIAHKTEVTVQLNGLVATNEFFTIAQAMALVNTLRSGNVAVDGDIGTFTARARDIGWVDVSQRTRTENKTYRFVTCVLEEV